MHSEGVGMLPPKCLFPSLTLFQCWNCEGFQQYMYLPKNRQSDNYAYFTQQLVVCSRCSRWERNLTVFFIFNTYTFVSLFVCITNSNTMPSRKISHTVKFPSKFSINFNQISESRQNKMQMNVCFHPPL